MILKDFLSQVREKSALGGKELTLSSIYTCTHFNTMKKKRLGKHGRKM